MKNSLKLGGLGLMAILTLATQAQASDFQTLYNNSIKESNKLEAGALTGDSKLACEAILCLASPTRLNECQPSLRKYFSLKPEHRPHFLAQCPKQ